MRRRDELIEFPQSLAELIALALSNGPVSGLCRQAIVRGIALGEIGEGQVPRSLRPTSEQIALHRQPKYSRTWTPSAALGRPRPKEPLHLEPCRPDKD